MTVQWTCKFCDYYQEYPDPTTNPCNNCNEFHWITDWIYINEEEKKLAEFAFDQAIPLDIATFMTRGYTGKTINSLVEKGILVQPVAYEAKLKIAEYFRHQTLYPYKDDFLELFKISRGLKGPDIVGSKPQYYPTTAEEIAKLLK